MKSGTTITAAIAVAFLATVLADGELANLLGYFSVDKEEEIDDASGNKPSVDANSFESLTDDDCELDDSDVPGGIACPALRYLARKHLSTSAYNRFAACTNADSFKVDTASLKSFAWKLGFDKIEVESGTTVAAAAFNGAIDDQAVDGMVDLENLQVHFDHGASTGIIGKATANPNDKDAFNQDKYDKALGLLTDGDATKDKFYEADVGRMVNDFGPTAYNTSTVGEFSWAVLAFEYANLFSAFKQTDDNDAPYLSKENFVALFDDGGTHTGITKDGHTSTWSLQTVMCKMQIRITNDVIAAMDADTTAPYSLKSMLKKICGDEFLRCKEGYTGGCGSCTYPSGCSSEEDSSALAVTK